MANEAFFIAAQTDVVPIAWGMPGTGKTRTIEAFGRKLGVHTESISLSQYEPTDISGYPCPKAVQSTVMVDGKKEQVTEEYTSFAKPEFLHLCEKKGTPDKPSLLFLDELTTCSPSSQASALRLMTHGVKNTRICCAANPPGVAANGYPLEPPMNNRLYHHKWDTSAKEWSQKFMGGFQDDDNEFPILPDKWEHHVPKARVLIAAFLNDHPGYAQKEKFTSQDRTNDHGPECAWHSLRSWTNASTLLGAAMSLGLQFDEDGAHPICSQLLHGSVGEQVQKFITWRKGLKLTPPREVYKLLKDDKFVAKHMPKKSDEALAFLAYCLSDFTQDANKQNLDIAWKLVMKACEYNHRDLAVATKDLVFKPMAAVKEKIGYKPPADAMSFLAQIFDKVHGIKK